MLDTNTNRSAAVKLAQGILPFKLEIVDDSLDGVTAYAGLPLVLEALCSCEDKKLYRKLRDALGYKSLGIVERHLKSLVLLIAAGGTCVDDVLTLRADAGLQALLTFSLSSPTQLKDFLYRFHQAEDGRPLTPEDDAKLSVVGESRIRPEGPGLRALAEIHHALVDSMHARRPREDATLDVDATILEANKKLALKAYEGTRGYQPQMAWWAEQQMWVLDEFRDGNVPAAFAVKDFLVRAFRCLAASVPRRSLRADSALYDEKALTWADEQGIRFAVSADMSEALAKAIRLLPEDEWKPYRNLRDDGQEEVSHEERQWAEVEFVPNWARNHKKNGLPLRYIAIRVRARQQTLPFSDLPEALQWRCFAVVTNIYDWDGERVLQWHRKKQGTVEHGHGVLKNDLAGGTLPCGRFGANAAWWRINVIVHNLLQLTKVQALPPEMQALRPKALRFRLFNVAGRIVRGGRQVCLRLSAKLPAAKIYAAAREVLLAIVRHPEPIAATPAL